MPPDSSRPSAPQIPSRDNTSPRVPERQEHRDAAADIARTQIGSIMATHDPVGNSGTVEQVEAEPSTTGGQSTPADQPVSTESLGGTPSTNSTSPMPAEPQTNLPAENPYHRSHQAVTPTNAHTGEQWKKYHSAWQRYYQEYYSRYYVGELYKSQTELMKRAEETAEARKAQQSMTQSEAMDDLRSQVRSRIAKNAGKVRNSRHFMPIMAAVVVMLVFGFLQYNSFIFASVAAYTSPGNISPTNIIVNPNENIAVPADQDNRLIIPKLNIDVPVDFNAQPDYDSQMAAMKSGTAYFGVPGANAKPGEVGNFGIAGHSSNQWYDSGSYKFIFVNLSELTKGDSIYINYQQTRYTYTVTKTLVVDPTDVAALQDNATKPEVTLITCTPSGTALHRLLVVAEQVSPSPDGAKQPSSSTETGAQNVQMPGNAPTVFEKLFGNN